MPILVFRYGLRPPVEGEDVVSAQMSAAHKYRNALTAIERDRRKALRALDAEQAGGLYEAAVAAADNTARVAAAVKEARVAGRSTDTPAEVRDELIAARAAESSARKAFFDALKAAKGEVRSAAMSAINATANEQHRAARAACGVYWGTYLLVEEAHEAACKVPLYDGVRPNDPPFVSWDDDAHVVGVQITTGGGEVIDDFYGREDTRLQIDEVDPRAYLSPVRGERAFYQTYAPGSVWRPLEERDPAVKAPRPAPLLLRLRVGSEGRAPVWAAWPIMLHREIPPGSMLKRAAVHVRYHGRRAEWWVSITVALPAGTYHRGRCGDGAVAVNLGWRSLGGSLRVGMWADETGAVGEIAMAGHDVESFDVARGVRAVRDTNFNAARDALVRYLDVTPVAELPAWMPEKTKSLAQWRSADRLQGVVRRWLAPMLEKWDEDGAENTGRVTHEECADWTPPEGRAWGARDFARWAYRDWHLDEYEDGARCGAQNRRKDHYRKVAAELARRYDTLVVDDFDMREVAKHGDLTSTERENERARSNRVVAAASDLRMALVNAFKVRGGTVEVVKSTNNTQACADCGTVQNFDAARKLTHACTHCGVVWDQDANACRNALKRWRERRDGGGDAGTARSAETPKKPTRKERFAAGKATLAARAKGTARTEDAG